jgi:hypothetical protein
MTGQACPMWCSCGSDNVGVETARVANGVEAWVACADCGREGQRVAVAGLNAMAAIDIWNHDRTLTDEPDREAA